MTPSALETQASDLISKRIAEINEERGRLEQALAELQGGTATPARRGGRLAKSKGRRGRPKGSSSKAPAAAAPAAASGGTKRRRRRRGGTRSDQAVKLIASNPGISASEIAKAMKIKPNYLYRVLSDLEKEGRVKKDGRSYSAPSS